MLTISSLFFVLLIVGEGDFLVHMPFVIFVFITADREF